MQWLTRFAEQKLEAVLKSGKVVLVLGPRQVGKTSLVERVLQGEKTVFLNLDLDIDLRKLQAAASLSPADALAFFGHPAFLVIDEAQRLPESTRMAKAWQDGRMPVTLILLGSSSLTLLDQGAEPLTGRNRKILLPPLLFGEALQSQAWYVPGMPVNTVVTHFGAALKTFLLRNMAYGSYPEAVLSEEPQTAVTHLASDYLWKDVLHAGLVKSPALLRRLLGLLAHQAGSEVSLNELATQLQSTRPTVEKYLDLLEQCFVLFRLPAFSTNPRKEISKSQKIFFWDTGMRNALLQAFSVDALRPDIGSLWENWVVAEVAKKNALLGNPAALHFWRSRAQSEVDLVVKTGERLQAFEIKWKNRPLRQTAFRNHFGVEVELLHSEDPFVAERVFPD